MSTLQNLLRYSPLQFSVVGVAAASLASWTVLATGGIITILSFALALWLLALAAIDLCVMRLPDALTLPLIPLGLLVVYALAPERLLDHTIGAAAGWGFVLLVGILFTALRGKPGLGGGDAKLLAAAGAWLGWQALPTVIGLAALTGLVVAGVLRLAGKKIDLDTRLPFGPPLCFAFYGVWLHGPLLPA